MGEHYHIVMLLELKGTYADSEHQSSVQKALASLFTLYGAWLTWQANFYGRSQPTLAADKFIIEEIMKCIFLKLHWLLLLFQLIPYSQIQLELNKSIIGRKIIVLLLQQGKHTNTQSENHF